ncbi:VanZ family protein [Halarchaeum sp. P4]|uniref:VanZ family protein n=1 Tax=Halarchaeum sp. P4 TaxID=3421639 RepID=UPI003EB8EF68
MARRRLLLPLTVAALVVGASLLPETGTPTAGGVPTDLLFHAAGGVLLVLAGAWALRRTDGRALLALVTGAALLGGTVELAQGVVPGRHPSLLDFLADALGAVVGALVARYLTVASRGP